MGLPPLGSASLTFECPGSRKGSQQRTLTSESSAFQQVIGGPHESESPQLLGGKKKPKTYISDDSVPPEFESLGVGPGVYFVIFR